MLVPTLLLFIARVRADVVLETVPEDEVYYLQFGQYFEQQALDPNAETVERDDFALSMATGDE